MLSRTYIAKSQKSVGGYKTAKDPLTILLCSNGSGVHILKPLVVNKSLSPRAMKRMDFNSLPVHWKANKKGLITNDTFNEWFIQSFVVEVKCYLTKKFGM